MPLKVEAVEEPALNLTPMVDVVLLLIIFFMVGTQFTEVEHQYDIELPTVSDAQPLTAMPDELVINVRRDGEVFLGDRNVSLEQLEQELRGAQARFARQAVVVRGDGIGPYQNVMTVLDVCRRARIVNIQLANRVEAPG
jgi:biopolymer transport protein ExbD